MRKVKLIVVGAGVFTLGAGVVFIGLVVSAMYQVLQEQGRLEGPLDLREVWQDMQTGIEDEWGDFLDDAGLR